MEGVRGRRANAAWAAVSIAAAFTLAAMLPGSPWLFALRAVGVAAMVTALAHLLVRPPQLSMHADPPELVMGGYATLHLTFAVRVPGFWQVYVRMLDHRFDASRWFGPGPAHVAFSLQGMQRGLHEVEAGIVYRDPLGLIARDFEWLRRLEIAVRPQAVPMDPERLLGASTLASGHTRRAETQVEPAGARPYQPGDRLSRVHWPQTARTGRLQVRESLGRGVRPYTVVLETDRDAYDSEERFELAVSVATSLVLALLRQGWRVGLCTGAQYVSPLAMSQRRILDTLTRVQFGEEMRAISRLQDQRGFVHIGGGTAGERFAAQHPGTLRITVDGRPQPGTAHVPDFATLMRMSVRGRGA